MTRLTRLSIPLVLLLSASTTRAQDAAVDPLTEARSSPASEETHPIFSNDSTWIASLLVGVTGLFTAAAIIGPIIRSEEPDAVPLATSHEEDPAIDRPHPH